MSVFVVATLSVAEPNTARVIERCLAAVPRVKEEDGVLFYDFVRSQSDPGRLLFIERWESRAAFDTHVAGSNAVEWWSSIKDNVQSFTIEVATESKVERLWE